MVTFNMSRSASYFESGMGRGMGFRDSCVNFLPDIFRRDALRNDARGHTEHGLPKERHHGLVVNLEIGADHHARRVGQFFVHPEIHVHLDGSRGVRERVMEFLLDGIFIFEAQPGAVVEKQGKDIVQTGQGDGLGTAQLLRISVDQSLPSQAQFLQDLLVLPGQGGIDRNRLLERLGQFFHIDKTLHRAELIGLGLDHDPFGDLAEDIGPDAQAHVGTEHIPVAGLEHIGVLGLVDDVEDPGLRGRLRRLFVSVLVNGGCRTLAFIDGPVALLPIGAHLDGRIGHHLAESQERKESGQDREKEALHLHREKANSIRHRVFSPGNGPEACDRPSKKSPCRSCRHHSWRQSYGLSRFLRHSSVS